MKTVQVDQDGCIPLDAFADLVDITQVHSYRIENDVLGAIITFYDIHGDQVKVLGS